MEEEKQPAEELKDVEAPEAPTKPTADITGDETSPVTEEAALPVDKTGQGEPNDEPEQGEQNGEPAQAGQNGESEDRRDITDEGVPPGGEITELARKQEDNLKAVVEALLFAYEKPLTADQIKKVLDNLDAGQVRRSVEKLMTEYEEANRGMRIVEVAGGYKMISAPHFSSFLRKLFKGPQSSEKLSGPAMETLAIIAYRQPISKLEIESLRKVNADGVVATLTEKNLVRVTGRKDAPGRPKVYGTTREFLEYFGLKSLEDLPKPDQFMLSPEKQAEVLMKFADDRNSAETAAAASETPSGEGQTTDELTEGTAKTD